MFPSCLQGVRLAQNAHFHHILHLVRNINYNYICDLTCKLSNEASLDKILQTEVTAFQAKRSNLGVRSWAVSAKGTEQINKKLFR